MNYDQQTLESMSQAIWYNKWTLKKFEKYLSADILEIGCGIGNFTETLTRFGNVWAIDINKDYIEETKKLVSGGVSAGFGDVEKGKFFFSQKKFDSLICLNVLEHIKNDTLALRNMYALLKNKGFLIILVPAHPALYGEIDHSISHFRRYAKNEIINKLENVGFRILRKKRLNMLGAIGWFIVGKIFKMKKINERSIKFFNFLAPLILSIEDLIEPPFGTSILIIAQKKS